LPKTIFIPHIWGVLFVDTSIWWLNENLIIADLVKFQTQKD